MLTMSPALFPIPVFGVLQRTGRNIVISHKPLDHDVSKLFVISKRSDIVTCMHGLKSRVRTKTPPQLALPHKAAYLNPRAAAAQPATSQIEGSHTLSALYGMASHGKGDNRCRASRQRDDDLTVHQHAV
jgi:hypothetical protein